MGDVNDEVEDGGVIRQREERQCYICLEVAEPGVEAGSWVSPCRCSGSMGWVHQQCLLLWIRELEQHNEPLRCTHCLTHFLLTPEKGTLLSALDFLYKRVVPVCKYLTGSFLIIVTIDTVCITIGVFTLTQVYGVDEMVVMLKAYEDPLEAVVPLQLISYSLFLISYLPWDNWLLRTLRKFSRLPLLSAVLPADLPARVQEPPRKTSLSRVLAEMLLLPVFANIIGTLFFSSVESPVSRVLVGGAVYLSLECTFFMYLNQKLLQRQHRIRVLPIEEVTEISEIRE